MNASTVIDSNELSPVLFVKNAIGYADTAEALAGLRAKSEEFKEGLLPFFKAHEKEDWKTLGKLIKTALAEANAPDINGKLGALKTCFEHRILPSTLNADRLRKAETWINWQGKTIPNAYKAKHVDAKANQPAPTPTTPSEETMQAAAKMQATVEATQKANAKATDGKSTGKVEIPRANLTASETLTTSEHWDGLYRQFANHGMTAFFIRGVAGALAIDADKLAITMKQVHDDMMAVANKTEKKA